MFRMCQRTNAVLNVDMIYNSDALELVIHVFAVHVDTRIGPSTVEGQVQLVPTDVTQCPGVVLLLRNRDAHTLLLGAAGKQSGISGLGPSCHLTQVDGSLCNW
jgi:hypothetical protein